MVILNFRGFNGFLPKCQTFLTFRFSRIAKVERMEALSYNLAWLFACFAVGRSGESSIVYSGLRFALVGICPA
jgi:hypothetical protein